MFKKRYMFVLILLITLTTLSTVSASDLNTTDEMIGDELSTYDELEQTEDIILDASRNTFTDLNNLISSSGSTVTLNRDYEYVSPDDGDFMKGIEINKALTINGNGHTIYANGARTFLVRENADVTINGVNFVNNNEYNFYNGGTIYNKGNLTLINCEFTNSSATISGGAIYSHEGSELEIYSCRFTNNSAYDIYDGNTSRGGAIRTFGFLLVYDSNFTQNSASYAAGAVYGCASLNSLANIINCRFIDNSAKYGGAIDTCELVDNCSFISNHAGTSGGAMYNCSAMNCIFNNNSAKHGGAMWAGAAVNCIFINNSAEYDGGAIRKGSTDCCIFINNSAEYGGAIDTCELVDNCSFISNHAGTSGGAMYNCSAMNCIFNNNSAEYGGAMWAGAAVNCIFINNSAWYGGAIKEGSADCCIFEGNVASVEGHDTCNTTLFKPTLSVPDFTSSYNSGEKLIIDFSNSEGNPINGADVTIDIYKDGAFVGTYNCINDDGWVVNLPVGTYVAVVSVKPGYLINPVNATIKINKEKTKITSQKTTVTYNDGGVLVATLTSADTGKAISDTNLVFKLNDKKYTIKTDSKGQAKLSLGDLSPKEYTISISYAGNSKYASSSKSVTVIVNKAETSISAIADNTELVATLTHKSTGKAISGAKLVASINGKSYSLTTDSNGEAILPSPSKEYTATISYAGNSKYKSSSKTIATKTKTSISAVYDADKNVLTATLTKGSQGKAMSGFNVQFEINGKITTVKTNSNGQAKISPEGLPYGTYQATISYNGNTNYNAAKTRIDFTTKTVVIVTDVYAYSDRIVAKLTNGATGKTIANANMIVEINGVKYNVKSDNKGLLTFDTTGLNLPDSFDLTISYRGNDRYTASSATVAVDLNKANMMITTNYHADKQKMVATLKNSKTGKVVSNANMIIDLNGVKTTYKSNDQGKITLPTADFAPGTYVGTVTYPGNARYNSISAVFKVDV